MNASSTGGRRARALPALAVFAIACAATHGGRVALAPAPPPSVPAAPAAPTPEAPAPALAPSPAASPAIASAADAFERTIRPLLFRTCTPCHVPGGRMYERLPFDQAQVVRDHREGVLRRLKGDDHAVVEAWLDAGGPPARPQ